MEIVKRPKVKFTKVPYKRWLPEIAEFLDFNVDEVLDHIPNISEYQTLDDVFRLRCNHLTGKVLPTLLRLKTRPLRQLYQKACYASYEYNKTYMITMLMYRISDSLDMMTNRMRTNYNNLCQQGPEGIVDIYGGTWRRESKKGEKKKSSKQKKQRKERGPTVTGIIVAYLSREQGATKKDLLAELVRLFPSRVERSMSNTISVQLSSHLKKKFGDKLVKDGNKWRIREE